jgi:hypothetical protein
LQETLKALDMPGPETARTIRAIMVLERIGSADARSLLEVLAQGASAAHETEEARASLQRLAQRADQIRAEQLR